MGPLLRETDMTNIDNSDDVIDSRDVIARIEELEGERGDLTEALEEASGEARDKLTEELQEWDDDNGPELSGLKALADAAEGYSEDWEYGATLIRDSYFEEYARELCEEIGDLPKNIPHYIEIDWTKTARNIRMDYTSVEFEGVTYWVR